ncbi:hypothetical protein HN020_03205 [Brevibacillus borstelensis]|uniref:hypothetical protein n=1 Tax=Brevibacillus TaxID=55080 RepID=UPI00148FB150|nr:hypothetical protein [Brevibacillus borstelensis]MCC0566254.1 hypothetical protein [Brevibacillus borstelensis]MED1854792.1 hypothetical protein [Brevibacillus borstelensis]NOU53806.1 hypothetical protein [Brevibacillus borstelensis]
MGVSNANKQRVCEKYKTYLEIIYHFGNKVMLLKQLYQYAELLGRAKNFSSFYGGITELVNNEVLRKDDFTALGKKTQLQMLTLRKYAIRFIEKKPDSYSVASLPKRSGNERIMLSIFKNYYIINKVVPRARKEMGEVSFESIVKILIRDYSTIPLSKNQGISFLSFLRNDKKLQPILNIKGIDQCLERMRHVKQKQLEAFKRGSFMSEGKGIGKTRTSSDSPLADLEDLFYLKVAKDPTKEEKIDNYTVDTMLSFNAYIAQIKIKDGKANVTVLIFDIHNKRNIYRIVTHIACIYNMFSRFFNGEFLLRIGIVSIDNLASKNLKSQAESQTIDFNSKERKGTRQSIILKEWRVDEEMQKYIDVQFVDYDITNQFLDGIKHANLIRR